MKMPRLSLSILLLSAMFFTGRVYAQDNKVKLREEIVKTLDEQISKQKRSGYLNFVPLYITETATRIRVIYQATNEKISQNSMPKIWLLGYSLAKNGNQWVYGGGRATDYSNETQLKKMKNWADEIEIKH